jgi:glycosyltransferase involved in cell wall biosynthesis
MSRRTLLHLTHTVVGDDPRILRALGALGELPEVRVHAFGVAGDAPTRAHEGFELREFRSWSRRLAVLPRAVRYTALTLELNSRFLFRLAKLRPAVVHCHDALVLPVGVLARILCKSTLVYDAHELESNKAGQSKVLSKATLLIERLSWRWVDHLITVSPSIATWYSEHLGPKPTTCILNSPHVDDSTQHSHHPPQPSIRDVLGLDRNVPLFVYVGALEPGRGIELLLQTFTTTAPPAHIAFVGSGRLAATINEIAQHHRNIHHCAPVPHDQLVNFISNATAGFCLIEDVSLSDRYSLPNKLFEYAFAGLPVIAARLPDIEHVINTYQLGICTDPTPTSITKAINLITDHPRNLPTSRLQPLTWPTQAHTLQTLYLEL